MNKKQFILFFISIIAFKNILYGQDYAEQYLKCSERLKGFEGVDSVYMIRLYEKDSCLTGTRAPNFRVNDINGRPVELSKFKGQVVFLNFWGTYCRPCIEEIPKLNELVEHYKEKGIKFISLASDKTIELKEFLKKNSFHFIQVANAGKISRDTYKLTNVVPYSIIIDRSGKIYSMTYGNLGDVTFSYYKQIIDKCMSIN